MRTHNLLFAIATSVTSGILLYFGTGLHPIWWLLWLAPVPVLAVALRLRRLAAFFVALVAWVIGLLNQWTYFTHALELPVPFVAVSLVVPAIVFGLGVLFTRTILRRGSLFIAALAFPVFWVSYEYLVATASPHSTFGNLAYTQMNCLPLIQIASITGIWGITFIVLLFAGTTAVLFGGMGKPSQRGVLALTIGIVTCALFVFGEWRLRNSSGETVAVTLIGKDEPMSIYLGPEEQGLELLRQYAEEIRRDTPAGTQVIVLPEKIARVNERALPQVDALFSSAATATHAAIDLGLVRLTPSGGFNSSRFYSADGMVEANYDKHHLLPGVEPEIPGDKRVVVNQPSGRWGLQICKDMDFPKLSREYAREGANLLLVPAWDFNLDRWLHARMAVLRAVENGFALARSSRNGLLTLSDNRGRILAEAATVPDRFVSINGKVNVAQAATFYTRSGDWFAWLCVTIFIVLLGSCFFPRRSPSDQS